MHTKKYHNSWQTGGSSSRNENLTPDWKIGPLLLEVNLKGIAVSNSLPNKKLQATECKYVASYNWVDGKQPAIMVPGSPPLYTPPITPTCLPPDDGKKRFRDGNAARYPKHPSEPGIRALFMMNPDFHGSTVDFAGCGNTLGNLIRFVSGLEKDFRFDIDLVGNTIFFLRKENSPTEVIEGMRGYNLAFTESYTTWKASVAGSISHQRLITYDFGGFKLLVRSECDGYLKDKNPSANTISTKKKRTDDDGLVMALGGVGVATKVPSAEGNLAIEEAGEKISQKSIFDLKTRSLFAQVSLDMNEIKRRLWAIQTPNFVFARHRRGFFLMEDIEIKDIMLDIQQWENENQDVLQKLKTVLSVIQKAMKENPGQKLQVVRIGTGPLWICKQVAGREVTALPKDLADRWALNVS